MASFIKSQTFCVLNTIFSLFFQTKKNGQNTNVHHIILFVQKVNTCITYEIEFIIVACKINLAAKHTFFGIQLLKRACISYQAKTSFLKLQGN
jgi:hypothetical protein